MLAGRTRNPVCRCTGEVGGAHHPAGFQTGPGGFTWIKCSGARMSDLSPFSMMMGKKVQKTLHVLYILNVRAAVQYISFMDGLLTIAVAVHWMVCLIATYCPARLWLEGREPLSLMRTRPPRDSGGVHDQSCARLNRSSQGLFSIASPLMSARSASKNLHLHVGSTYQSAVLNLCLRALILDYTSLHVVSNLSDRTHKNPRDTQAPQHINTH